jgi:serine/threonine-protein kinase
MTHDPRLSELLLQWEDLWEQGQPVSVEVLCRDCPELADELRRRVRVLQAMPAPDAPGPGQATPPEPSRPPGLPTLSDTIGLFGEAPPERLPAVPGYEVLGELGRGGMGVVYLARHTALDRRVALKMTLAGLANEQQRKRFRTEAAAVARLQHPNVVQVFEVGEADGRPYCALELVDGGNLAEQLDGRPRPPRAAAELVAALADAIQAAHVRGIIHRDLKPANVLLTRDGRPKVTDFGLAKRLDEALGLTRTGVVVGTPQYMAPEQAGGENSAVGAATDIHALGAILYELLTGRPPFRGPTTMETLLQVRAHEPVPPRQLEPGVPRDLDIICMTCLRKDPARRYATAAELAADLRRFLAGEPVRARRAPPWERVVKWARRRPAVALLLALCVVWTLAMVLLGIEYTARLRAERDEADRQRQRAEAQEVDARIERDRMDRLRQTAAAQEAEGRKEKARADKLREQAEDNFRLARTAVDSFSAKLGADESQSAEELRQELLRSSLAFYQQLVKQRGDDAALRAGLGWAYLRLAIVTGELGSIEARALPMYNQAIQVFGQLWKEHPDTLRAKRDYALARYHLGCACNDLGRYLEAEKNLTSAEVWQKQVTDRQPGNAMYRCELARIWLALGQTYQARGYVRKRVEAAYRKALALLTPGPGKHPLSPADESVIADIQCRLGSMHFGHREPAAARDAYLKAVAIEERLVRQHPSVVTYAAGLATAYHGLGLIDINQRRLKEAAEALEKARVQRERLVADHPALLQQRCALGEVYRAVGRTSVSKERLEWYDRAIGTLRQVLAAEPQLAAARQAMTFALAERAQALTTMGRYKEALDDWTQLSAYMDLKKTRGFRMWHAQTLAHLGRYAEAATEVNGLDWTPLQPDEAMAMATVYGLCARAAAKDSSLAAVVRDRVVEKHAARAVALLGQVRASRHYPPAEWRQLLGSWTAFETLRGRADFKKLLDDSK